MCSLYCLLSTSLYLASSIYLSAKHTTGLLCLTVQQVRESRFTVAEWLMHLAATLEVIGSRPSLGDISDIYFLESIQSLTQRDLKWSV